MINYIKNNIYKIIYFLLIIILFDFKLLSIITGIASLLLTEDKIEKKRRYILSFILFIITIIFNIFFNISMNILSSIIGYCILFFYIIKNKNMDYKESILYWIIPLFIYVFMEITSFDFSKIYHLFIDSTGRYFLLLMSFLIIKLLIDLLSAIIGYKISSLIVGNLLFIVSIINFFTMSFIGKSFSLDEISLAGTAFSVISNYSLSVKNICLLLILLCFVFAYNYFIIKKINITKFSSNQRIDKIILSIFGLYVIYFLWYGPQNIGTLNYVDTKYYGTVMEIMNSGVDKFNEPEAYDTFKNMKLSYVKDDVEKEDNNERPNIIFIMNEAFSDLSLIDKELEKYNATSFVNKMIKEGNGGYLYSSVFGNNTVSSEFESITGISTALTTKGAKIYNNYINENIPSLAKTLHNYGYYAYGVHPYESTGYNRKVAWKTLGFDETIFVENFDKSQTIREYVSDQENYNKIIKIIEDNDEPVFIFNTTMQNHGGYGNKPNISDYINVGNDNELNNYLTLIKESDRAIEELIGKCESLDEETIIVFFGDHQPGLTSFYNDLTEESLKYKIPYFIWTNGSYKIEEFPKETSMNYLPAIITEMLGIEDEWFNGIYLLNSCYPVISEYVYKINDKNIINKSEWNEYIASFDYEKINEDEINLKIYESLSYKYIKE